MPDTSLEFDAARAAISEFGLDDAARIDFIKYRENHVYRVRAAGLDLALRMHRPGYRTDEDVRDEIAAMSAFSDAGVAVPSPRRTSDGKEIAVVIDSAGVRRQATMLGWFADTEPMGDSAAVLLGEERPARLRELGRLMAQLHEVAERLDPAFGASRPAWDAAGLTGPDALWGPASLSRSLDDDGRETLRAAEARLASELAALPRDRDRFGYIHADLTFENVLASADGLVAIDFDDSGPGWFLFDLATTFHWCAMRPDAHELLGELAAGYRQLRAITPADAAAWEALLLARALSYLGWSAARPGDPVSEFHEARLVPWTLSAARQYLETGRTGWSSLADFVGPKEQ